MHLSTWSADKIKYTASQESGKVILKINYWNIEIMHLGSIELKFPASLIGILKLY